VGFFLARAAFAHPLFLAHDSFAKGVGTLFDLSPTSFRGSLNHSRPLFTLFPIAVNQEKETLMYRLRFAALAVLALGVGLISGCLGLAHRPLLGGRHAAPEADCCDIGAVPDGDMALGGGSCCTVPGLNGNPAMLPPPNLAAPGTNPLNAPQGEKLVPIPNNAPRMPYNPGQ
jgi:hypothetical protein